jgi:hypothetical protein
VCWMVSQSSGLKRFLVSSESMVEYFESKDLEWRKLRGDAINYV